MSLDRLVGLFDVLALIAVVIGALGHREHARRRRPRTRARDRDPAVPRHDRRPGPGDGRDSEAAIMGAIAGVLAVVAACSSPSPSSAAAATAELGGRAPAVAAARRGRAPRYRSGRAGRALSCSRRRVAADRPQPQAVRIGRTDATRVPGAEARAAASSVGSRRGPTWSRRSSASASSRGSWRPRLRPSAQCAGRATPTSSRTAQYVELGSDTHHEIVGFTGNISLRDDRPFLHAHATFADATGAAPAVTSCAAARCSWPRSMIRRSPASSSSPPDAATGLALW